MFWKPYKSPRAVAPALLPAVGVLAGVLMASAQSAAEFVGGGALLLAAITWSILDRRRLLRHLFVLGAACLAAVAVTRVMAPAPALPPEKTELTLLLERVSPGSRSQRAVAALVGNPDCRLRLVLTDVVPGLRAGDTVRVNGTPMPFSRYDGAPYTRTAMLSDRAARIGATVVVAKRDVELIGHNNAFRFRCDELRNNLADAIHASGLPPAQASLLNAAILGGSELPADMRADFRAAGLAHLLCVSGFHVGLVAALILGLLYPLRLHRRLGRPIAYGITIALVWLYTMLTGFGPSVIRAAAMLTLLLLTRLAERHVLPLNTLCVAFCVVLLINPYDLYSAGFQLSFAAVAAILLIAGRLNPVPIWHPVARNAVASFLVPLAATLGTLPVVLMWFHRVSLAGVLINGFVGLFFPLFMLAGALVVLTHAPHGPLADLTGWLYSVIERSASFGSELGMSDVLGADTLSLGFLILALISFAGFAVLEGRRRLIAAGAIVLFAATAAISTALYTPRHILYVDSGEWGCNMSYADSIGNVRHIGLGTRSSAPLALSHYYAAHGAPLDEVVADVVRTDTVLHVYGLKVHYIHRKAEAPLADDAFVNLAIVGHRFKGSLSDYLAAVRPGLVCLASALAPERRAELAAECALNSIPCHDLADKVFFKTLRPDGLKINE